MVNPQPDGDGNRTEAGRKIRDLETASWNAAFANYREQIALYNFTGAAGVIKSVRLSDASLKQAKETAEKKAQWLIAWKNNLIYDFNRAHFSGAITDSSGAQYTGLASTNDESLSLRLRHGIPRITGKQLSPTPLSKVTRSLIQHSA